MRAIQKVVAITIMIMFIVSKDPTEILLTKKQEVWESYLYRIIRNREVDLLYTQQDFEINLEEYMKQDKLSIVSNPSEMDSIKNYYESSYLIDIDKDGIDELYVITCEGSIRQYYGNVFKKKNEAYVLENTFDGHIIPIRYNNDLHFISIENDFETKFIDSVIEYGVNGLAFKPKEKLNIIYTYDSSEIPESMTKMLDNEYLNSLNKYEMLGSNTANITKISEQPSYDVQLIDDKYKNVFNLTIKLWLTSVGYAPNHWEISTHDDSKHHFKGMEQIEANDESVCYGLKFYKDKSDQVFLVKISYPFYTLEARKDGDLIIQLFKFHRNFIEEVENIRIEPEIEVRAEIISA
ncbi:hypothetical protein LOZ80_30330 [Paenibacillus sp. HWE-109]|uniref:hypothetical protein n=1 Tax=Paenibacillus sp. HWE-109 TaxID=1306526 RepID=UPI001EDED945|nr:hypothetical protein [Paenibacillus sp. HWE-109]UKS25816.1 hypothetical protein LOZ80_30330 [Paenibacillus sp. HWE-109]